ncbi:uncharacterized protein METZ01_LOCUS94095 [marine metagenome]|uniref:Uncharacterized protein n=1 Tax=marine metagenome TaxID=408172 RepID=A0A381VMF4_9ZZZZ
MAEEQAQDIDTQKQYLMAKINELTDGIAPGYGEAFLEELMGRLEKTVSEFNEEVSELLESLKVRSAERDEKLKEMLEGGDDSAAEPSTVNGDVSAAESEMSDWEKRLETNASDAGGETEPAPKGDEEEEEEKPKKKGFFSRKKKKKK